MLLPRWFLLLNGVGLLLMGGAMVVMRLRGGGAVLRSPPKLIGLFWSLLCCGVGVALVLMSSGWLNQPGAAVPFSSSKRRAEPVFPADR